MAELVAEKREILGRRTRHLRKKGFIPAELYGHGIENIHLSIPAGAFSATYKETGGHAIVNIIIDGDSRPVLISNIHIDSLTDEILSVDLHQVRMDEKVVTHVPIDFVGESPAERDLDGVLIKVMDEIEVEALPANIPQNIQVDLSKLTELGQSLYVKDLELGGAYSITADPDTVVASVSEQRVEAEPVAELTPEDVVVEGEEKRAKEGEEEEQPSGDEQGKKDSEA